MSDVDQLFFKSNHAVVPTCKYSTFDSSTKHVSFVLPVKILKNSVGNAFEIALNSVLKCEFKNRCSYLLFRTNLEATTAEPFKTVRFRRYFL